MGNKNSTDTNLYWCGFHDKISRKHDNLLGAIERVNRMINDIVQDYHLNNDATRAYHLTRKLDNYVNELFDGHMNRSLAKEELQSLTNVCRRMNEDPTLQEIRDLPLDERYYGEDLNKLPLMIPQVSLGSIEENANSLKPNSNGRLLQATKKRSSSRYAEEAYKLTRSIMSSMTNIPNVKFTQVTTVKEIEEAPGIQEIKETKEIIESNLNNETDWTSQDKMSLSTINANMLKPLTEQEKETAKQEIDKLFERMKEEFEDHNIDFAYDILRQLKELFKNGNLNKWIEYYINSRLDYKVLMDDIENFYKEVMDLVAELDDDEGYSFEQAKENITVKHKKHSQGKIAFKFEAVLDVPIFDIMALLHEPEQFWSWSSYCKEAREIKRIYKAGNIVKMKWDLPKPISSREGYMMSMGFNRMDVNGSILFLCRTIHNDKNIISRYGLDIPAATKKKRMDIDFGGIELTPLSKNKTIFKMMVLADPKIKMVPTSVMSWAATKGAIEMFNKMAHVASRVRAKGSLFHRNIENSLDFYEWLQRLVDDYLGENGSPVVLVR